MSSLGRGPGSYGQYWKYGSPGRSCDAVMRPARPERKTRKSGIGLNVKHKTNSPLTDGPLITHALQARASERGITWHASEIYLPQADARL
jgi:hypothetical protein